MITTVQTPKQRAVAWARRIAADPAAVFLDTETTGLGLDAEIVDLAIVALDGTVLLDTLVKPLRPIPAEATAVHGIRDEDVAGALSWPEVFREVARLLSDNRQVVVFNAKYDSGMIDQCCRAFGLRQFASEPHDPDWHCAMLAFADFDGTPGKYPPKPKWWKLGEAAERLGIEVPRSHRALADAETARLVVLAMAESA